MTRISILLDCWCNVLCCFTRSHEQGYMQMCTRLEVWPTVGLSRQRHLFRVLSTHTGPTSLLPIFSRDHPLSCSGPREDQMFKRIGPPYPHACHRWQLKLTPACMRYNIEQWIWRSRLGLWVVCWIRFPEEGVRHGSPDRKSWPCSYLCDGTDVQADWRRSCTYGPAPNAIDIS